jgi:mannosidase alpha-like ER degradation enhancer 1
MSHPYTLLDLLTLRLHHCSHSFVSGHNYVFSTEGHPLHVLPHAHNTLYTPHGQAPPPEDACSAELEAEAEKGYPARGSALSSMVCPLFSVAAGRDRSVFTTACHERDRRDDHRCDTDDECGVDAASCRARGCSKHGYCA